MLQQKISKIEYLLQQAKELYYIVNNCHDMIERLEGTDLQEGYIQDTLPLVQEHTEILNELINEFEEYFKLEQKENAPVNLRYRRLYNEMKKDSTQPTSYQK